MALSVAESMDMSTPSMDAHLEPQDVARYVDRATDDAARERIEAHLAACAECRSEVVSMSAITASMASRRRHMRPWLVAAAAAGILLVVATRDTREPVVIHREAPVTSTVAPRAIAPIGATTAPLVLRWSSVPNADGYRARIYDGQGSVLFERETTDTLVAAEVVGLQRGQQYYWKVEARAGFDRTVASELTAFSLRTSDRP